MQGATEREGGRRPIFLVIALLALWLVGMNTFAEGWVIVSVVRDPLLAATGAIAASDLESVIRAALVAGIHEHPSRLLPLGVAEILLGGLLVGVAAKALFGRRASPSFALQVIAANAAIVVMSYALRQPVRERIVEAVARSGVEERPPGLSGGDFATAVRAKWWWSFRVGFSLQLMALGLSALAITRPSARELLAPDQDHAEEEG